MAKIIVKDSTNKSKVNDSKVPTKNMNGSNKNAVSNSSANNVFQRSIVNELKGIKSILTSNTKSIEDIVKTLNNLNKNSIVDNHASNATDSVKKRSDDLEGATEDAESNKKVKPVVDAINNFHKDVADILGTKKEPEKKPEKKEGGFLSTLLNLGKKLFSKAGIITAALIAIPLLFYNKIKSALKPVIDVISNIYHIIERIFGKIFGEKQRKEDVKYNEESEVSKAATQGTKAFTDVDVNNTKYDIEDLKKKIKDEKDIDKKKELERQLDNKYIDLDTQENQIERRKRLSQQEKLGLKSDIYHTQDGKVVDMGAKVGFWRGASTWLKRNFTSANNLSKEEKEKLTAELKAQGKSDKEIKLAIKEADEAKTKEWNAQRILDSELANSRVKYGDDMEQEKLKADIDYSREQAQEYGLNTVNYSPNQSLAYQSKAKKDAALEHSIEKSQNFSYNAANEQTELLRRLVANTSGNNPQMSYPNSSVSNGAGIDSSFVPQNYIQ